MAVAVLPGPDNDGGVTVELARRLLDGRVLSRRDVAEALRDALGRGVSFVQVLIGRTPRVREVLDAEFSRFTGPVSHSLRVDVELALSFPIGMCERLLAVPLKGASEGEVAIAMVDPFDRHVLAEFAHHLGRPTTPVRTSYALLVRALDRFRASSTRHPPSTGLLEVGDESTPPLGTPAPHLPSVRPGAQVGGKPAAGMARMVFTLPPLHVQESASDAPIPLVRPMPSVRPLGSSLFPRPRHTLPPTPPRLTVGLEPQNSVPAASATPAPLPVVPSAPRLPTGTSLVPQDLASPAVVERSALDVVHSLAELTQALAELLSPIALRHAVFAVKSGSYVLLAPLGVPVAAEAQVASDEPSLLGTACRAGYFFGPLLKNTPDGEFMTRILDVGFGEEVYALPVTVQHRPVLVVVCAGFDNTFSATRRIDQLMPEVGAALSRIVREKRPRS